MNDILKILINVGIFAIIAFVLGLLIGVFSKIFYVEKDKKLEAIRELLPGANCGSCGFSGCDGLADAIKNKQAEPSACKPNSIDNSNKILEIIEKDA